MKIVLIICYCQKNFNYIFSKKFSKKLFHQKINLDYFEAR